MNAPGKKVREFRLQAVRPLIPLLPIHPISAFTLIEMLIVVAIMSILAAATISFITIPPREQVQATTDLEIEQGLGGFFTRLVADAHNATTLTLAREGRALIFVGSASFSSSCNVGSASFSSSGNVGSASFSSSGSVGSASFSSSGSVGSASFSSSGNVGSASFSSSNSIYFLDAKDCLRHAVSASASADPATATSALLARNVRRLSATPLKEDGLWRIEVTLATGDDFRPSITRGLDVSVGHFCRK